VTAPATPPAASTTPGAMSPPPPPPLGTIGWTDLTVTDAERIRDFYKAVVGWTATPLDMGGYSDYVMQMPGASAPAAGICHARGQNAALPPQWIPYIVVANLEASVDACTKRGGRVIEGPRSAGPGSRFCVIEDPAGAVAAIVANDRAAG
jgi:predicted enzyme related to lactoylglutathione lyase